MGSTSPIRSAAVQLNQNGARLATFAWSNDSAQLQFVHDARVLVQREMDFSSSRLSY